MRRLRFVVLMLISMHSFAESLAPTDQFIATLSSLLEQGSIGDDELLALIDSADAGDVQNPISDNKAKASIGAYLAHSALSLCLEAQIDSEKVALWATQNLKDREAAAKHRHQREEETVLSWIDTHFQRFSAFDDKGCFIQDDDVLSCFGNLGENGEFKVPLDLGPVVSVSVAKDTICVVKTDLKLRCFGRCAGPLGDSAKGRMLTTGSSLCDTCWVEPDGTSECLVPTRLVPFDFPVKSLTISGFGLLHGIREVDNALVVSHSGWLSPDYEERLLKLGPIQSVISAKYEIDDRSYTSYYICAKSQNRLVYCWEPLEPSVELRFLELGETAVEDDFGFVGLVGEHDLCTATTDGYLACLNVLSGEIQKRRADKPVRAFFPNSHWQLGTDGKPFDPTLHKPSDSFFSWLVGMFFPWWAE